MGFEPATIRFESGEHYHWAKSTLKRSGVHFFSENGVPSKNAIFSGFLSFLAPQINFTKPLGVIFDEESNEHYMIS